MEIEEYRRMAAVEDTMWYYRALHVHVERELMRVGEAEGEGREKRGRGEPEGRLRILDAGCGTGGLIRRLEAKQPCWEWTGVDAEPVACELARARCGAEIVEAKVEALPFAEGVFDAVVSADVLYHLDDDATALAEMVRVLKPGGVVVVNVPAHRWLWSYHDVATHARRRYVRQEVKAKLCAAGLEAVRATHWNMLPLPLVIVRRKLLPAPSGGSDVRLYPAVVEAVLRGAMAVERGWIAAGGRLALGSSILAVGRKG